MEKYGRVRRRIPVTCCFSPRILNKRLPRLLCFHVRSYSLDLNLRSEVIFVPQNYRGTEKCALVVDHGDFCYVDLLF